MHLSIIVDQESLMVSIVITLGVNELLLDLVMGIFRREVLIMKSDEYIIGLNLLGALKLGGLDMLYYVLQIRLMVHLR